ncbi:DUF6207 family protein [Streptomyces sp. JV176]|uniref:DUF6207 family protein n=1 Tax=Streptomyces sp. JV176 TaxID=858630 RepID=UPI002E76733A|nr:DUF6207 family protein [Streptomyces sp. JV176]MEE1797585.1 DUF6207 family protein [Streptomyces sp. JV176]
MDSPHRQHVSAPGLLVIDITAADEATAHTAMTTLDRLWATSGPSPVHRAPGQAGVKAHLYVDLRRRPVEVTALQDVVRDIPG